MTGQICCFIGRAYDRTDLFLPERLVLRFNYSLVSVMDFWSVRAQMRCERQETTDCVFSSPTTHRDMQTPEDPLRNEEFLVFMQPLKGR